ncbi:PREDICTED: GC-rich sequence DNA-binding factor 2 [Elephantulus edwardii]|uniref:GC-rich sequence DNA-binding factor 2 n=1 Tax=Elephantulus edwardii TaxID=28737 RepID=UPI0003F05A0B|nr:PREDICTED: GC-rich sequence DNA-binding factor 2 [Elephantulus edwardii]
MAHRPQRAFRQRRADSSGSDDGQASPPEPRAQVSAEGGSLRSRRPRARVWASSRRAAAAAPRAGENSLLESRAIALSSEEEDGTRRSSEKEDHQSSSSSSSSSPEEKDISSTVRISGAAFIQAARRRRELARAHGDYLPLDVTRAPTMSALKKDSEEEDPCSEPDDQEERILFAPKPQMLRERMAEAATIRNEEASSESQEDENQDTWEQQQMRKAVKIVQGRNVDLSHSIESEKVKKFDTSISFPPVNLEIIKKRLNTRLTLLQDTHRSHQREYEKCVQDIKSSQSAIQTLEDASGPTLSCRFYKSMKVYVDSLIDCLNEKIASIQELESSMHALLLKQALTLMKRRQDELKCESTYLQQLSRKTETLTNGSSAIEEETKSVLEELASRRAQRRPARLVSGSGDHEEGTSSDDELPSAEMAELQERQGNILKDRQKIFEDVHDDFCNIKSILLKFQQWREKFPDSYYEAFISLCIPKLLNPLVRIQLLDWNPLKPDSVGLKQTSWFTAVQEYVDHAVEHTEEESSDRNILSGVINKAVIPRLTDFVEFIWDPLSTSQTTSLIPHCRMVLEEHVASEKEVSKSHTSLCKAIVSRIKKAIEDDVFIPLYPKSVVENETSPHSAFQERQFWSAVKLFRNVLRWQGLLPDAALQELTLGRLLGRYLLTALLHAGLGPGLSRKCSQVAACLPEKWFENPALRTSLPQLENFCQLLVQSAETLARSEHRDEVKEIIVILVRMKALNQARSLIEGHHLDHLRPLMDV